MGEGAQAEKGQARRRNGGRERREGRMPAADGGHRMGRGRPERSPRAAASLPARRRRRGLEAPQMPGSLARPPVLVERRRRRGGRDGGAHSGGSSAPGLGCCVSGGGGSGGGSGPTRTVTIVRDNVRSRAEPVSSRRRPWPPVLSAPPPGTLRRPRSAVRSAPARGAAPPPRPPRARARPRPRSLTIARVRGFPRRLRCVGGRDRPTAAGTAWRRRLWKRAPGRLLRARCDTRHSDTRALSHSPLTRSHPHSPAGTTWESWLEGPILTRCNGSSNDARRCFTVAGLDCQRHGVRDHV